MFVTLGIAAVQKSAEDTLIGAEMVQKMIWSVRFKIKRAFRILRVLKKQSDIIFYGFAILWTATMIRFLCYINKNPRKH